MHANEYVYPVAYAHTPYGIRILLIYQGNDSIPGLYTWDPETKIIRKGMPSHYTPSHVNLLPDESGFSFIDNGIIRIKKFAKRSARTIEMLDPLYDILSIHWIDNVTAYACAKRRACYEIFEIDCEGIVEPVVVFDRTNCLYPQKVDTTLFYIECCDQDPYNTLLVRIDYPMINRISSNFNDEFHFDYRVQRIIQHDFERNIHKCHADFSTRVILYDLGASRVIGFTMVSHDEGLLFTLTKLIDGIGDCLCFRVQKDDNSEYVLNWLFDFRIPMVSLESDAEAFLYESYMPLLPTFSYDYQHVYFADISLDGYVSLFTYNFASKNIDPVFLQRSRPQHFFKPLPTPQGVWCGGSINTRGRDLGSFEEYNGIQLWVNEDHMVCLQLPFMHCNTTQSMFV